MKKKSIFYGSIFILFLGYFYVLNPRNNSEYFLQCPIRKNLDLLCPTCGMQQALHYLLHGEFNKAFQQNWLSIPIILFVLTIFPLHAFSSSCNTWIRKKYRNPIVWIAVLSIALVYFFIRNFWR